MAFPRHFKRETWYARLPSGDVELLTASALESAFSCGLVDARTPVRTPSSSTWTTLQRAADLEPDDRISIASLTPTSMDTPLSDEGIGARWSVTERDVDPRAIRPSRAPLAMPVLILTVLFAVGLASLARESNIGAAAAPRLAVAQGASAAEPALCKRRDRFTEEQRRRLREIDFRHRWEGFGLPGHASHVVSKSEAAFVGMKVHLRGDPLDGAL